VPAKKNFLNEVQKGIMPVSLLKYADVGHTHEATRELQELLPSVKMTPKPVRLIKHLLQIASDKDSLVLDSFAGSGTTGHAVLAMNKADGGNRRFVLVEMDENICGNVTVQRLSRVVKGYEREKGNDKEFVQGLGSGFSYCTLGEPLFDEAGSIREHVKFPELAAHIFFTETGTPIPKRATGKTPLLGEYNGKAVYLLFNGVMGDKSPHGGNVLTNEILKSLPEPTTKDGTKVVYGEGCRLGATRLKREGIVFKQVPYEIKVG
jgi:site-specific DNA-methyltransferase (adenine-specific)/adenine-specific DNA-methyltransferase